MRTLVSTLTLALLTSTLAQARQWSVENLSAPRTDLVAVAVGDLVLFAGGNDMSVASDVVDVYDGATGSWRAPEKLSVPRWGGAAAALGDLAFFAGGGDTVAGTLYDVIDIYDTQAGTWIQVQLSQPRALLAAATVGNKVFFAGGAVDFAGAVTDVVDIYDADLGPPHDPGAWYQDTLSQARGHVTAVTAGDDVLFAGGFDGAATSAVVDIYHASTDSWEIAQLSQARFHMGAAALGSRAFFGGGSPAPGGRSDVVDIYDAETQSWSDTKLSSKRFGLAATAVGERVLFAGGGGAFPNLFATVDVYHVGSGQWEAPQALSLARFRLAAATVDGKALFAGGLDSPASTTDRVDVYDPSGGCAIIKYCGSGQNSNNAALIEIATCHASSASITVSLSNGPPNQFAYLLVGDGNGTASQPPGSSGDLCVVGGTCLGRYDKDIGPISAAGTFGTDIQNALSNPCGGGVNIDPGVTWNFQFWHRMPMGAPSTFSQAVQVTFQ